MASNRKPGCCCSCTTTVCVKDCVSVVVPGATVTVISGGTTIDSQTTGVGGCCLVSIPSAGTYEVRVGVGGSTPYDANTSLTCGGTVTINLSCCVKVCVKDCSGFPYTCSATVTIKNATTGATVGSGTTDPSTGCVVISATAAALAPLIGGVQKATVEVTPNNAAYANYSAVQTVSCSIGSTTSVTLLAAVTPSICCKGLPIPQDALTLTDANGSFVLTWFGGAGNWQCCYTYTQPTGVANASCSTPLGSGTIAIIYTVTCTTNPSTGNPSLVVSRQWRPTALFPSGLAYARDTCATSGTTGYVFNTVCSARSADSSQSFFDFTLCSPISVSGSLAPQSPSTPDPIGGTVAVS